MSNDHQTIFPRINFLKTFSSRFDQRHLNGRIFLSGPGLPPAALNLNFASSKSLTDSVSDNNLITFSRASTGTYVDSAGLIQNSAVNLATYSEDISNAAWLKLILGGTITATANTTRARDGTLTGETLAPEARS